MNKGISEIKYNYLNLPTEVIWNSNKRIHYAYDANGVKLRKIVIDGSKVTTTDYLGGFQYVNNILQFFPTAEGYVNVVTNKVSGGRTYNYVYNYTDHLGNVRLSYAWDDTENKLKILEENHYYPFGLKHKGYQPLQQIIVTPGEDIASNRTTIEAKFGDIGIGIDNSISTGSATYNYKFGAKEWQDELGLNWDSFKWRNYDYAIGRFFNHDPLSEKYVYNSPYAFQENKMGMGRELEGLELETFEYLKDKAKDAANYVTKKASEAKQWTDENKPTVYVEATASVSGNVGVEGKVKGPVNIGFKGNYKGNELGSVKLGAELDSKANLNNSSEVDYYGKDGQVKETSGFGLSMLFGFDQQNEKKVDQKTKEVTESSKSTTTSVSILNSTIKEKTQNGKTSTERSNSAKLGLGVGAFLNVNFGVEIGIKFKN